MDKKDSTMGIEKLFNFRPVFFAALFLCLGIVFCFFYYFYGMSALWLLCLLPLAGMPFFFCRTRETRWKTACAIALLGCFFFLGFFSFFGQICTFFDREGWLGEHYVVGYVVEKREYENQTAFILDGLCIDEEKVNGKLIAYLPTSNGENIQLCDELFLQGKIQETTVSAETFSLTAKQLSDGVRFRVWTDDFYVTGKRFDLFLFLRMRAEERIDNGMDQTSASVTKALLFGSTDGIDEEKVNGKLIAYLPTSNGENIQLCDELFLQGKIQETTVSAETFSLTAKQLSDGVRFRVWTDDFYVTGKRFDLFLFLRMRAEERIDNGMDQTSASVTKALLFGSTDGIDEELYENIRKGGVAHIFAVSGLHVGTLYGFCFALMKRNPFDRLPKLGRFSLLALLLFGYAGVCGFSASVLRAVVICLVSYASDLFFIRKDSLESLGLALIFVLLCTPSALFEVGCQLSFASCFGIAFLSKPIGQVFDELKKLYRKRFPRQLTRSQQKLVEKGDTLPLSVGERMYRDVASFFSASFGAQIFTAPIMLKAFGYVSGWGILLNCLFIPLVSAVFSVLLLLVVIACLLPVEFALMVLYIPNAVWSLLLLLFQTLDFSSFAIGGLTLSFGSFIAYYFGWIFCTDKFNLKRSLSLTLAGVCLLTFIITMFALNLS